MPHAQHGADGAGLLGVPRERLHAEAVEQRHEARGPLACGACSSRRCRARTGRARAVRAVPSIAWRRVECTSLTAGSSRSAAELGQVAGCRPRAARARRSAGATSSSAGPAAVSFTSTESSKSVPSSSYTSASRGHAQRRQLGRGACSRSRRRRSPAAHRRVVGADDLAVGAQPHVGLEGAARRRRAPGGRPGACSRAPRGGRHGGRR